MGKIGKGKKLEDKDNVSISNKNSIDADFLEGIIFAKEKKNFQEKIYRVDEESKKSQSEISDTTYQKIAQRIVDITETNLQKQEENKKTLRKPLQKFIMALLSLQFAVLVLAMFLNDFCLHIEAELIKTYIVSVFAETLLGLTIMISFAFSNKEEVQLISILNSVISEFKIFGTENNTSKNKNNSEKD